MQKKNAEYQETHICMVHSYLLLLLSPSQSAFRFNGCLLVMEVPLPNVNTRLKQRAAASSTSGTTNSKQYPV